MSWGCLVSQHGSRGHPSTGRPRRCLPAPFTVAGVGLRLANRDRVQVFPGSTELSRRRGSVRARRCHGGWRLRALVKAGLLRPGDDAGATALHLLSSSSGKRDTGVSLAPRAESTQQSRGKLGGSGRGGVASSLLLGHHTAPLVIEHVHLSNNRLKQTARGRPTRESLRRTRAAA